MKVAALLASLLLASTAGCAGSTPAAAGPAAPAGDVEARLRRLEANWEKHAAAIDFLAKVYAQQQAAEAAEAAQELDADAMFAVAIAADVAIGKVDGPADAPVTIIKAFDFACPYCQRMSPILDELVQEYAGKVRVVYKDLVVHPDVATDAHLAACAAAKQGTYKAYKNAVWTKGFQAATESGDKSKLAKANLIAIAKELRLDTARLATDMASAQCKQIIQDDMAELARFHVNGTPAFFINGKYVAGAVPKEAFKQLIDEQLAIAQASGIAGADYYDKVVLAKGEKQFKSAAE